RSLARLHAAGDLDRAGEEEQLLGEGGLAGVGVRDDREGTAPGNLRFEVLHEIRGERGSRFTQDGSKGYWSRGILRRAILRPHPPSFNPSGARSVGVGDGGKQRERGLPRVEA